MPTKTVLIVPPDSLLNECAVDSPPDIVGVPIEEQRNRLVDSWVDQTFNVHACNVDKATLREWKAEQEEVYGGSK